ncbi:MAG TPA: response regulator [Candidatus Paceibacterota bacterium]
MNQYTVLIADDERTLLGTLSNLFTSEGFSVVECVNGEEVVAKGLAEKPHILLLDVQMPQKDGLQALKEIREQGGDWGKNVPAVFLTNIGDAQNIAGAMDLKAQDYLIKADMELKKVLELVLLKLNIVKSAQQAPASAQ